MRPVSTVLIVLGISIVVLGVVIRFAPWLVSWFGNLPGDISIERESTRIHIPLVSMMVVSVLLTVVANLVMRGR